MKTHLSKRLVAEFVGTMLLVAAVVGSGIMAEKLSNGNAALALLANTIATGAALVALILSFGPTSGAHFNPAVSICQVLVHGISWKDAGWYVVSQCTGGILGVILAHAMYGLSPISQSQHTRNGAAQLLSEFVATFGLLVVIWGSTKSESRHTAFAVGAYITSAYWFTSSTSFANPAVTLARAFTDSFTGIRFTDVAPFIVVQIAAAILAARFFAWLNHPPREPQINDGT